MKSQLSGVGSTTSPTKILIVDDEESCRELLLHYLSSDEFEVTQADTGASAFQSANQNKPDLIVLDYELPDSKGSAVCERLKRNEYTADIPILFLSSHDDDFTFAESLQSGGIVFASKPVTRDRFLAYLDPLLKVSETNKSLKAMQNLALEDGLMRIANRRSMEEYLGQLWAKYSRQRFPWSLVMIDVDNFKTYNDNYGHPQGDKLLVKLADVIKVEMRQGDQVFRYGGEEIVLVLENASNRAAVVVIERIRQHFFKLKIPHCENEPYNVATLSAGVAQVTRIDNNWQALLARADNHLYISKKEGKNQVTSDLTVL